MNERPTGSAGQVVEGWQPAHSEGQPGAEGAGAPAPAGAPPGMNNLLQHHDQSPFALTARNHHLYHHHHHHLTPHQPPLKGMANGLSDLELATQHFQPEAESDADEEVRSLDLPAQVGIDLRSKRSATGGSTEALDRERPMSWEGELSDQEVSQMDQKDHHHHHPRPATPPNEPPPPLPATFKTEPADQEMEGIESVGPGSPQPMCIGGGGGADGDGHAEAAEADDAQLFSPPQPPPPTSTGPGAAAAAASTATTSPITPTADAVKTEAPWGDCPKAELTIRPVASMTASAGSGNNSSSSGSGSSAPQRPTFGEAAFTGHTPLASPLTSRHPIRLPLAASGGLPHPPTPSPDSAIHSAYYSPTASPGQSRHRSGSGLSSPYSHRASPSLSRNNSDASQYSVHSQFGGSSQYSYSSAPSPLSPSPAQSPVQPRHMAMLAAGYGGGMPLSMSRGSGLLSGGSGNEFPPSPLLFRHAPVPPFGTPGATPAGSLPGVRDLEIKSEPPMVPPGLSAADAAADDSREGSGEEKSLNPSDLAQHTASLAAQAGISRQQLINSPCPICGDKISGFHYGIFSCESCKGFFKRTVQNKKNYVCLRGAACPVTIATRKKCPACRFEKCLNTGMKLEAIREDRTRGGRSTYQCTYAVPSGSGAPGSAGGMEVGMMGPGMGGGNGHGSSGKMMGVLTPNGDSNSRSMDSSSEWGSSPPSLGGQQQHHHHHHHNHHHHGGGNSSVPALLLEIMNVEHLWHCNEQEAQQMQHSRSGGRNSNGESGEANGNGSPSAGPDGPDSVSSMCSIADHRLYKIVKWCKSLPLFKNIQIDDQISLLINTWCELLLFACCFRSMDTPGEIRISHGKSITLEQARALGLSPCIERMINFTDHLRRLRVDQFEYAAMKVIILLSSDTSGLKESESVRSSQESVLKALQQYTLSHYPDVPSKFGELLLRIPELERTCQVGKDMLTVKREDDGQGFNLLMELLRGDH